MRVSVSTALVILLLAGVAAAMADLKRQETTTIVVYTTPALKDLLEKDVFPRFEAATGDRVEPVYVAAGEQYNRLRMSGTHPEADVFLHASPLYLEKGYRDGYFEPVSIAEAEKLNASYMSRAVPGGRVWYAFAWSPLAEVYAPRFASPPDLATADVKYGLADPLLSNNGIYHVIYFEALDPAAGAHALARTRVQPVNGRATIGGVADGSFDVTLGYEAVTLLYQEKGARVAESLPILHGNRTLVPVLFSAGLVKGHPNPDAQKLIRFLFTNETQARLAQQDFRPVLPGLPAPKGALDVSGVPTLSYDWSRWEDLESKLPNYEVRP